MKRLFCLSPLVLFIPAGASQAQEADFEMVIEAVHMRNSETALPITLLNEERLKDTARTTIGDTLSSQPGINNASFGPVVGQPVIRGQQGARVMTLTNSLPDADASGSSPDHANTVEPMLAESVEVLRGPSTLLYGGGAIGGIVNVLDNRIGKNLPQSPVFGVELRHDTAAGFNTLVSELEVATRNVAWHLDLTAKDWGNLEIPGLAIDPAWLEGGQGENSYGYIPNTDGDSRSGTIGASYIFNSGYLGLSINRSVNDYGLPPGAHVHLDHDHDHDHDHDAEDTRINMENKRYDLAGEWRDPHPFLENVKYRLSYTDYNHVELEGAHTGTRFTVDTWQQRLQFSHSETRGWHGVLGLQTSDGTFVAAGEESFVPPTDIRSRGIFMVEAWHTRPFTFEFGARLNYDRLAAQDNSFATTSFSTQSLSGSALWDMDAVKTLGLAVSHAQRAPTVEELFSNFNATALSDCVIHFATGACEVGNSALNEETSNNVDLTLYLDYGAFDATVTAFYNDFRDYIYMANTGQSVGEAPVRAFNQTDAVFSGLEVDTTFLLTNVTELRLFGDIIKGRLDSGGDVPRVPAARIGAELKFDFVDWSAYVSVLHAADQDKPGMNELPTAGYTRWEAGGEYRFMAPGGGDLTLFLKGRNLGDEDVRLASSFLRGFAPEAGRSIEAGLRYRF